MADRLNWSRGRSGKGLVTDVGDVHTWNVNPSGGPHHGQYAQNQHIYRGHEPFFIDPDGFIHNDPFGPLDTDTMARALTADPNLHIQGGQDEDWTLDPMMPGGHDEGHGPDYNYILGSVQAGHHFHPYTGRACRCPWARQ